MKNMLIPVVLLALGISLVFTADALAGDRDNFDKARLMKEVDRRIEGRLNKFRRQLLSDIKKLLESREDSRVRGKRTTDAEKRMQAMRERRAQTLKKRHARPRIQVEQRSKPRAEVEGRSDAKIKIRIEKDGKVWEKEFTSPPGRSFDFAFPRDGMELEKLFKKMPQLRELGKELKKHMPRIEKFGRQFGSRYRRQGRDFILPKFDGKGFQEFLRRFLENGGSEKALKKYVEQFKNHPKVREFTGQDGRGRFKVFVEEHQSQPRHGRMKKVEHRVIRRPGKVEAELHPGGKTERRGVRLRRTDGKGRHGAPTLESLRKEKDQLSKELRELRRLLERLLRQHKQPKKSHDF